MRCRVDKLGLRAWVLAGEAESPGFDLPEGAGREAWMALLGGHGLVEGLDLEAIEKLSRIPAEKIPADLKVLIARGTEAIDEGHIDITYHFEAACQARGEGQVDYRHRNYGVDVIEGQLLAEQQSYIDGVPGKDVYGKEIKPGKARDLPLEYKGAVYIEKSGPYTRFLSRISGVLLNDNPKMLDVQPELSIQGSVNFETGNISTSHPVHVFKDVEVGFSVRAKTLTVDGFVDSNAVLESEGDIQLTGLAQGAKIRAGGSVKLRFAQGVEIEAGKDVHIEKYVYDSKIRAGGRIICKAAASKGDHGAVVGGNLNALGSIELSSVGSAHSLTVLSAGFDVAGREQLLELGEKQRQLSQEIRRKLRQISVDILDKNVAQRIKGLPEPQKTRAIQILSTVLSLRKHEKAVEENLKSQSLRLRDEDPEACISISDWLYPDVKILLGETELNALDKYHNVRFHLANREIAIQYLDSRK
ncbi:MAG: DUF342 domain-containing protein [Planctomycetes bacterium]|nr:DUF342 domain-containing protein [Planctomycetota bacterium]